MKGKQMPLLSLLQNLLRLNLHMVLLHLGLDLDLLPFMVMVDRETERNKLYKSISGACSAVFVL